jgi:hypothetical protein
VADHRGDDGRENQRGEGGNRIVAEDDLDCEHHPGHRSIEGGSYPRRGTAPHEQAKPLPRHVQPLADGRAQGRPDLDDRPLAPDRSSGGDAECRGQRLYRYHTLADPSPVQRHRLHHLRHPVTFGLAGEGLHQRSHEQATHRRQQQQMQPMQLGQSPEDARSRLADSKGLEAIDEQTEGDRAEAAQNADKHAQDNDGGIPAESQPVDRRRKRVAKSLLDGAHATRQGSRPLPAGIRRSEGNGR